MSVRRSYFQDAESILGQQSGDCRLLELIRAITGWGHACHYGDSPRAALDCYRRALTSLEEHDLQGTTVQANCENRMGNAWMRVGEFELAVECHQRALEIRRRIEGPAHDDLVLSLGNLGFAYDKLHRFEDAARCLEEAHQILLSSLGPEHPRTKEYAGRCDRQRARSRRCLIS